MASVNDALSSVFNRGLYDMDLVKDRGGTNVMIVVDWADALTLTYDSKGSKRYLGGDIWTPTGDQGGLVLWKKGSRMHRLDVRVSLTMATQEFEGELRFVEDTDVFPIPDRGHGELTRAHLLSRIHTIYSLEATHV